MRRLLHFLAGLAMAAAICALILAAVFAYFRAVG
jgi:hypothetical protein